MLLSLAGLLYESVSHLIAVCIAHFLGAVYGASLLSFLSSLGRDFADHLSNSHLPSNPNDPLPRYLPPRHQHGSMREHDDLDPW
jgi:hypothetical protein